jgi:butyryl-CoA dehydrogenase
MDLVGRKILRDTTGAVALLTRRMEAAIADAPSILADEAGSLRKVMVELQACQDILAQENAEAEALANATCFLRAFGHMVMGFIWLSIATSAVRGAPGEVLAQGKLAACRYFYAFEIPKVAAWLAPVAARSRLTLELQEAWL